MTPDDFTYALLLFVSLPLSFLIRSIKSTYYKQIFVATVGIAYVILTCGYSSLHSLITMFVNYLIITRIKPGYSHILSFIWCFGYLTFFRLCYLIGFPKTVSYVNAIQLLLTLKGIGLAFEIHDKHNAISSNNASNDDENMPPAMGMLKYFSYSYSFIGLLTGPYYKYQTFEDMIENNCSPYIPLWSFVVKRNKMLPIIIVVFLILSHNFKLEQVTSEWFYTETNLVERIAFMVIMFTIFRTRLYIAWLISETVCMMCGLGAYPVDSLPHCGHGPTAMSFYEKWKLEDEKTKEKTEYTFETIKSIDLWGCEAAPTIRQGMKSWNMTVQYWLATNVYKRTKFVKNNPLRVAVTMMVSAYWHGVHPGYYLSFIIIPFSLVTEVILTEIFNKSKWSSRSNCLKVFHFLMWFLKMRMFDYMCMGFLLLSFENTLIYWKSIYFCGHVFVLVTIVFGHAINKSKALQKTS